MEPTEEPEATLPDAEQVLAELDNVSFIYIVCGALILFYVFICGEQPVLTLILSLSLCVLEREACSAMMQLVCASELMLD